MASRDPGLPDLRDTAYAHAVFPEVDVVGGQLDRRPFAELVVSRDRDAADRQKTGPVRDRREHLGDLVVPGAVAAVAANFTGDVAVFTVPQGDLMAELPGRDDPERNGQREYAGDAT